MALPRLHHCLISWYLPVTPHQTGAVTPGTQIHSSVHAYHYQGGPRQPNDDWEVLGETMCSLGIWTQPVEILSISVALRYNLQNAKA